MSNTDATRAALQAFVEKGLDAQRALAQFGQLAGPLFGELFAIVDGSTDPQIGQALEIYMGISTLAEETQAKLENAGMAVTTYAAHL